MTSNPPCYRCSSSIPLADGQVGMCPSCEEEVRETAHRSSSEEFCACGWLFYNDWERIQHLVNRRHNYRAWTPEDAKRYAARLRAL